MPAEPRNLRRVREELRAWLAANDVDVVASGRLTLALGEIAGERRGATRYEPGGGELRVHGLVANRRVRVASRTTAGGDPNEETRGTAYGSSADSVDDAQIDTSDSGTSVETILRSATL